MEFTASGRLCLVRATPPKSLVLNPQGRCSDPASRANVALECRGYPMLSKEDVRWASICHAVEQLEQIPIILVRIPRR